jgi:thaumarchaeosortase
MYIFGFHTIFESFGEKLNVIGTLSWTRMWDYIIYTLFVIGMIRFSFNDVKALKFFPTPIVYAIGMAFILLLDSLLPHDELSIFEGVVSVIIFIVVFMLGYIGVGIKILDPQTVLVFGKQGTLRLLFYWPCVGILSMLIYFLVITILMIKLDISVRRKIVYIILGAVGTFFINVIRIFLIIYYGAFISVNLRIFHETIGEVIFIVWIVIFILIVTEWEGRRKRQQRIGKA